MGKKIILISPLEDFLINPKEFPPLGVLYLSSYLKQYGYDVDVLHGNPEDIKTDYDFYGISSTTPQYPKTKKFLKNIKTKNPEAKIILGGAHAIAPNTKDEALKDGFDYVVAGQGEKALLRIIEGKEKNTFVKGEILNQQEIDSLLPDRDAINMKEYGYPLEDGIATTLITTRGCPYKCSFCSISHDKLTFRNHKKVLEEISLLINKYSFNKIQFLDDSLTANKKRTTTIFKGLKDYKLKYRCYARSDNSYDENLLKLMADSGCIELGAGIESGSQEILDLNNKKTRVEKNLEFIKTSQKLGVPVNAFVMIGLPGETRETIAETREFMQEAKPAKFGYNIFVPLPDCLVVVDYGKPFESGKYQGKSFRDFITIYPMPYEKTVAKAKSIDDCFISTPTLSREDIVKAYHEEFEKFVSITGFDPRKRGNRSKT